jgi:hypothetical protein
MVTIGSAIAVAESARAAARAARTREGSVLRIVRVVRRRSFIVASIRR